MTPQQIYKDLVHPAGQITLRKDSAGIAHLAPWFAPALDHTGALVLTDVQELSAAPDLVCIKGQAIVCHVACTVQLQLVLSGGEITGLAILAALPSNWRITHSFPHLSRKHGVGLVNQLRFDAPLLVIAANCGPVSDQDVGLDGVSFENGLNLYATGLRRPGLASLASFEDLGGVRASQQGEPDEIKMHILPDAQGASFDVAFWWPEVAAGADPDLINGARILRAGWRFQAVGVGGDDPTETASWLWKLRANDTDPPYEMMTTPPLTAGGAPTHTSIFPTARFLSGGAQGLAAYADGQDLSNHLPQHLTDPGVELALASSQVTPGSAASYAMVVMDAHTNAPYTWQVIPDHLTLEDIQVTLNQDLANGGVNGVVQGIADLGGYEFMLSLDADPGGSPAIRRATGRLNKPHEVDVEDLLEDLIGHPTGLPDMKVKLLNATYDQDYTIGKMSVSMDIGGHIDLTSTGLLMLEQIGFDYVVQGGHELRKQLRGKIELFGLPIALSATHTAYGEWAFEGRADPVHAVHIDTIVDELLERMDLPVPNVLPDIAITEFGVGYGSVSKDIHIWGHADWTVPDDLGLPWELGTIHSVIDFTSKRNPKNGHHATTLELNFLYAPSEAYTFDASARFEPDMTTLYASWNASAPKARIGLNDVVNVLHMGDVLGLPDMSSWPLFSLSQVTLGYQSDPSVVVASAQSDVAGGQMTLAVTSGAEGSLTGEWEGGQTPKGTPPPTIGLSNILEVIGASQAFDPGGLLPTGMFDFTSLSLEVTRAPMPAFTFTGAAHNDLYREAFVSAMRQGEGWGFITGVTFEGSQMLGEMPLVHDILGGTFSGIVDAALPFEPSFVLYSSMGLKHYVPPVSGVQVRAVQPDQPHPGGAIASSAMMVGARHQNYHLEPGITVAGRLALNEAPNAMMQVAHGLLKIDTLDATVTLSEHPAVMARIPGSVKIPTLGDNDLILRAPYFGVAFTDLGPAVSVGGDITLSLFGSVREADVALFIAPEMISASIELKNLPLPPIRGLPGVQIDPDFTLQMAVAFEPPGFDLGLEGSFRIGTGDDYRGDLTVVMDMAEGVANPRYVRFTIETLSFWGVMEAVTGLETWGSKAKEGLDSVAPGSAEGKALGGFLDAYENLKPIFEEVSLSGVAFHWADAPLVLPDGSSAMPGVGFKGMLHLFGFEMYGAFDFSTGVSSYFSGRLEMEPIHLGPILSITGDGKGLKHAEVAPVSSGKDKLTQTPPADGYALEPGGASFLINSRRPPFLHASLNVDIFGISHTKVTADVDMHGARFHLDTEMASIVDLKIDATLTRDDGKFHLAAEGDLSVHLDASFDIPMPGPIPDIPIEIDGGFEADVTLTVIDGEMTMTLDGALDFDGADLAIPTVTLHEHLPHLDDLKGHLIDHIIRNAAHIFTDLISHLDNVGKLADMAVDLAVDQAEARVKQSVEIATKVADVALNGAKATLDEVSGDVAKATTALKDVADDIDQEVTGQVHALEKETHAAAEKVRTASLAAVHAAEDVANKITGGALKKLPILGHLVDTVLGDAIMAVADIAQAAEELAADIAHAAVVVFDTIMDGMKSAVKALSEAADFIADQLSSGLHWIGGKFVDAANVIGKGFHDAYDWTKGALNAIGDEISSWF